MGWSAQVVTNRGSINQPLFLRISVTVHAAVYAWYTTHLKHSIYSDCFVLVFITNVQRNTGALKIGFFWSSKREIEPKQRSMKIWQFANWCEIHSTYSLGLSPGTESPSGEVGVLLSNYLAKTGCIDWLKLVPRTVVYVMLVNSGTWQTNTILVMIIVIQPTGKRDTVQYSTILRFELSPHTFLL